MVLLVGNSGKLHCRWSLRGRRDTGGQLKFQFQLPPSLTKKLILTLPDSLQPDCRGGFVFAAGGYKIGSENMGYRHPGTKSIANENCSQSGEWCRGPVLTY